MTDILFPELEADNDAIQAFTSKAIAATEAALCDDQFEADSETIADIIEAPDNLGGLRQRGDWHYNFYRDVNHPRGVWRRLPFSEEPRIDSDWQTVFDLDAFCTETNEDWHWRGCSTLHSDPERVMITLSLKGSDQNRHIEWDCAAAMVVSGGFDLAPARSRVEWLDVDTLLISTSALPDAATRSGWPRKVFQLERGASLGDARMVFEVDYEDLTAFVYTFPTDDGARGTAFVRVRAIGDFVTTLEIGGKKTTLEAPKNTSCSHDSSHYAFVTGDDGPDEAGTLVLCQIYNDAKRVLFSPSEQRSVNERSLRFYRNHLFWQETDMMVSKIMRLDLSRADARPEPLPLPVEAEELGITPHMDPDGDKGLLALTTVGFLFPKQTWLFDGSAPKPEYKLLVEANSSFDPEGMEVRLHVARSEDGTQIPYHIVLPKDKTSDLPVLQFGYGGFSAGLSPRYLLIEGPLWLERGGAYVMAYIRGGSEFGRAWHFAAKGHRRANAFADFASIADDLVNRNYTTSDQIACHGGSNGGLLCGVMLTRYPEKFGAVWASVGVYDMLRYHLFPAGAGWIDEYGDPDDPDARIWLKDYSPLHNVQNSRIQSYPPSLIDTNESDDRVDPSHSRRFAAVLQAAGQPVSFHSRKGGHGGGGRTFEIARSEALGYAFLRSVLKMGKTSTS